MWFPELPPTAPIEVRGGSAPSHAAIGIWFTYANYDATLNVISGRRPKQPCIGIWSQRPRDQPGLVIWLGAPGPDVNSGFWLKVPRGAGLLYTCGHPASPHSVGIWFFHPDPGPALFLPSP